MIYRAMSQVDYDALVSNFIKITESLHPVVIDIGDARATIGFGYTFNRSNNFAIWTNSGLSLSASEQKLLQQIDAAPSSKKTALALQFSRTMSAADGDALLAATIPEYESPARALGMPISLERAAVVSLTYNRGVGAVNGWTELTAAIQSSERAESWFQIRYNTLTRTQPQYRNGIAKRRFVEADVFGLYDAPGSQPSGTEAKQIYKMLTTHRVEILQYESQYGIPPDGTKAARNMIA